MLRFAEGWGGYGAIQLRLRRDKNQPMSNEGVLLSLVAEMLDAAYESGLKEGLSGLRTVQLNLKKNPKVGRNYLDHTIKRLTERLSPAAQKDMAIRFGDRWEPAPKRRR